jgi:hypothetical protein
MNNNFSFDEVQRKDLFIALALWVAVEFISFLFFPVTGLISPGDKLRGWFLISLPLGIGGALLLSSSSRFMALANEQRQGNAKSLLQILGQFGGWIGLVGILYPLWMACFEFFTTLKIK